MDYEDIPPLPEDVLDLVLESEMGSSPPSTPPVSLISPVIPTPSTSLISPDIPTPPASLSPVPTSPPRPKKRKRNHAASAESAKRSFRPSIEDHYNEYQEVLEECARRKTTARQLLGTSYCTFTRVRRVAELFIVDPVKARRLFCTYPKLNNLSKHCGNELLNYREKLHELSEEGLVLSLYRK